MERNLLKYGNDTFNFTKNALLKAKAPLDCTNETSVLGFIIGGTEPENTSRRIIFQIDDKLFKFGNSGLIEYNERGNFADIIKEGNTVAELLELTDIPQFVGKKIFPIIALQATENALVMPKINISLKVNSFNDIYTKTEFSPVFDLSENAKIADFVYNTYTAGNASIVVYGRIFNPKTQLWTDYDYLENLKNKIASHIQFKFVYVVTTLDGTDFAACNYIITKFTNDADLLCGNSQDFITLAQDFDANLKTAKIHVKHSKIDDCKIQAFVNFENPKISRQNVNLGTATGDVQSLYIAKNGVVEKNVDASSLRIEIGGVPISDFYFDIENSVVTLQGGSGLEIFASYDILDTEFWREMELIDSDIFSSTFLYRLGDENKKTVSFKIKLSRLGGNVDTFKLSNGTGKLQYFAIPHRADALNFSCNAAYIYNENTQILKVKAPINESINVGYRYNGQFPILTEFIAGAAVI